MGLEGISINQLRSVNEFNSAELNSLARVNQNDKKVVDGLSSGQRVDPDKQGSNGSHGGAVDKNNKDLSDDSGDSLQEEVVKYDLSDTQRYCIEVDDQTGNIKIVDKNSKKVVQSIGATELLQLINFAPNTCGSVINKRF